MELILLKIKNLINKLNFPSWFHNWFVYKKIVHQPVVNNTYYINLAPKIEPSIKSSDNIDQPKSMNQRARVEFTRDQMRLITKINTVHKINGKNDYDFKKDYEFALYYIQHKPANDWPCNAALRIAQAMQDIDFFSAFEKINDPEKKDC